MSVGEEGGGGAACCHTQRRRGWEKRKKRAGKRAIIKGLGHHSEMPLSSLCVIRERSCLARFTPLAVRAEAKGVWFVLVELVSVSTAEYSPERYSVVGPEIPEGGAGKKVSPLQLT